MPAVKRTYGSRVNKMTSLSSPMSSLSSSPAPMSRKRPLEDISSRNISPPKKRAKKSEPNVTKKKTLKQLHFCLDNSILRTCPLCNLSYTKGAPDDESLHRAHCSRVMRGMEWGKEEEREKAKAGVVEIASGVRLKDGRKGRIICFKADVNGKIGSKLSVLLETISLALSSPPLSSDIIQASKIYLFLLPSNSSSTREKISGCVIAQRISTAMAITSSEECANSLNPNSPSTDSPAASSPTDTLVAVDLSTGLFCNPAPLQTPLGIPRLFVAATDRRQGIASKLLDAAAATFVHGCPLDPSKGEVAFTQPTGTGSTIMRSWGKGGVRIYEE